MINHFGNDVKIVITGISMGASTALMMAGTNLPKNVIGVLADCGFTSAKQIIKKVVKDTKEYDTWAWFNKTKNHHSLFLNVLLQLKGIAKFVEEFISCANRGSVLTDVYRNNAGQVNGVIGMINKKTNRYISNASNSHYQINFNGYKACLLYCDEFLSEIGNYICRDCKDVDIAILWNYNKIGFRTNLPGINLPKIVSKYGGNGRGRSGRRYRRRCRGWRAGR